MKRITVFALTLALALSLTACSNNQSDVTVDPATPEVEDAAPELDGDDMGVVPDMGVTPETEAGTEAGTTAEANKYATILADARTDEENEYFMVIFPAEGGYGATEGYSADYEQPYLNEDVDNFMAPMLGVDLTLAEDYAFSISAMMTHSYGVAIIMPTEGNTDAVVAGLESFVAQQRNSFQNYLPDQYEIASAATVTVAPTGEVILVCADNGADVLASIEAALAA